MLINILIFLVVVAVVFIIVVATRPDDFRVTRETTVSAPPSGVFPQVNDLRKWEAWNPWLKCDPAVKNTYEGPPAGVGAISRWDGNNKVGAGSMTVTESRTDELVRFRLEFLRPYKATNTAEFTFKGTGNQTVVTWSMAGKRNFMFKAMGLFMNMDKMIGGQFENGLVTMKSVVESAFVPQSGTSAFATPRRDESARQIQNQS